MIRATDVAPGTLLLATAELADPNFAHTVVLLLDVNDDGVLGVVLNRPSPVLVAEVLESWGSLCAEPEVLFRGGPVSPDGALAIALLRDADDVPVGFRTVVGRLGMLDLDTPVELLDGGLGGVRVYAGYAGWGAAQLREEIAQGSWYVVAGEAADAFRADTTCLWRDVLRRQPGHLAWHATRPVDPDLN
jgi:putative transcriptional regulator